MQRLGTQWPERWRSGQRCRWGSSALACRSAGGRCRLVLACVSSGLLCRGCSLCRRRRACSRSGGLHPVERGFVSVVGGIQVRILPFAGWEFSQSLQLHFRRRPRCPGTAKETLLISRSSLPSGTPPREVPPRFATRFRRPDSGSHARCTRRRRCPGRRWPRNGTPAGPRPGRTSSTRPEPRRRC